MSKAARAFLTNSYDASSVTSEEDSVASGGGKMLVRSSFAALRAAISARVDERGRGDCLDGFESFRTGGMGGMARVNEDEGIQVGEINVVRPANPRRHWWLGEWTMIRLVYVLMNRGSVYQGFAF